MTFISSSTNDRFIPVGLPSDPTNLELFGRFAKKYKENYDLGYEIASKTYSNIFNLDLIPEAGINELKKLETQFKSTIGNGNNVDWANPDNLKKAMDLLGSASSNPIIKNSLALTNQARVDLGAYKDDMDAGTASVINYSNFMEGQNGYNSLKTAKAEDLGGGKVKLRRYNPTFDLTKAKTDCLSKAKQDIQAIDSPQNGYIMNETTKQITAEKNRALLVGCLGESASARTQYRENAEYYHRNSTPEQRKSWRDLTTSNLEQSIKRSNTRKAELDLEYQAGLHKIDTDDKIKDADKSKYKEILKSNYETGLTEIDNSIKKTNVSIGRLVDFDVNSNSLSEDYLSDMSEALLSSDLYAMAVGASQNQYSRTLKADAVVSDHLNRMWEMEKEKARIELAKQELKLKYENKSTKIGDGDLVKTPADNYAGSGSNSEGQIGHDVVYKDASESYGTEVDNVKKKVMAVLQLTDDDKAYNIAIDMLDGKLDKAYTPDVKKMIEDNILKDEYVRSSIKSANIHKSKKDFLYNKMKKEATNTGIITALQTHFKSIEDDRVDRSTDATNNKSVVESINNNKNSESARFIRKELNISVDKNITESDLESFFNKSFENRILKRGSGVTNASWSPTGKLKDLFLKDGIVGEFSGDKLRGSSIENIFREAGAGNSNYTLSTEDAKRLSSQFVKDKNKGYYRFNGKRPSEMTFEDWDKLSQKSGVSFPRIVENITKRSGKGSSVSTAGEMFANKMSANTITLNNATIADPTKNSNWASRLIIASGEASKYDSEATQKPVLQKITPNGQAIVSYTDIDGTRHSNVTLKITDNSLLSLVQNAIGTQSHLDELIRTVTDYSGFSIYMKDGTRVTVKNVRGNPAVYINDTYSIPYSNKIIDGMNVDDLLDTLESTYNAKQAANSAKK